MMLAQHFLNRKQAAYYFTGILLTGTYLVGDDDC